MWVFLLFPYSKLKYEIVIVEDSSPDGTLQVARDLQEIYGNDKLVILAREGKLGLGSAYRDGLKQATGDFVLLMDADLSHHVRRLVMELSMRQPTVRTDGTACAFHLQPKFIPEFIKYVMDSDTICVHHFLSLTVTEVLLLRC